MRTRLFSMLLDVSMSRGATWSHCSQTETMRGKTKQTKPHTLYSFPLDILLFLQMLKVQIQPPKLQWEVVTGVDRPQSVSSLQFNPP